MQGTHIMLKTHARTCWGAIQVLRNEDGVGGVSDFPEKSYEGVRFDVICVMRGWVGVQFPEKRVT